MRLGLALREDADAFAQKPSYEPQMKSLCVSLP
jgi:hypothetical protein